MLQQQTILPPRSGKNISVMGLFSQLFVNQWSIEMNYTKYFDQCAPQTCTYSNRKVADFSSEIATFISIYGGLTIIIRLISFYLIRLLLRVKTFSLNIKLDSSKSEFDQHRICRRTVLSRYILMALSIVHIRRFGKRIKQFNLFKSTIRRTPADIQQQKIATQCFLISCIGINERSFHHDNVQAKCFL